MKCLDLFWGETKISRSFVADSGGTSVDKLEESLLDVLIDTQTPQLQQQVSVNVVHVPALMFPYISCFLSIVVSDKSHVSLSQFLGLMLLASWSPCLSAAQMMNIYFCTLVWLTPTGHFHLMKVGGVGGWRMN